jgi:hypothetical protein
MPQEMKGTECEDSSLGSTKQWLFWEGHPTKCHMGEMEIHTKDLLRYNDLPNTHKHPMSSSNSCSPGR